MRYRERPRSLLPARAYVSFYFRGMSRQETTNLTLEMAQSGDSLDLSTVAPRAVDKHSTGGMGDKVSLVVVPLLAALGLRVAKMSGVAPYPLFYRRVSSHGILGRRRT